MLKTLFKITIFICVVFVLSIFVVIPKIIQHRLISAVEESCASCRLSIGHTRLSLFPTTLSLEEIQFSGGNPDATAVKADIGRFSTGFSLRHLWSREFELSDTQVERPNVDVIEGDLSSPSSPHNNSPGPKFVIEGIKISSGTFSYTRVYGKRRAELHTKNLNGSIGQMGSIPSFHDMISHGEITGRLENSGEFRLTVATPLFAKDLSVDVSLKLLNQNLADLTPFFEVDSGLALSGLLIRGDSLIQIRDNSLHGWVMVQYRDLKIKLEKTKDRSALSAFFSSLISSAKTVSSNVNHDHKKQIESVDLQKKEHDNTVIKFILHGLRDAALMVTSKS